MLRGVNLIAFIIFVSRCLFNMLLQNIIKQYFVFIPSLTAVPTQDNVFRILVISFYIWYNRKIEGLHNTYIIFSHAVFCDEKP